MNTATEPTEINRLENLIRDELANFDKVRDEREKMEREEAEKAENNMRRAKDPVVQKIIAELLADAQKVLDKACESSLLLQLLQAPWPRTTQQSADGTPVLTLAGTCASVSFDSRPTLIYVGFFRTTPGTPRLSLFVLFPGYAEVQDRTTSLHVIPVELEEILRKLSDTDNLVRSIIRALQG